MVSTSRHRRDTVGRHLATPHTNRFRKMRSESKHLESNRSRDWRSGDGHGVSSIDGRGVPSSEKSFNNLEAWYSNESKAASGLSRCSTSLPIKRISVTGRSVLL